ncbi:Divalent-cation tolerance protein CutA [Anatilimnocola aggregata]|uniref:Divalent-cation tolerance protein CutA n=1 Tax=Anatilimnocola aggregata TaxID=2528021 RepID=A0A517YMI4_9BACT|nr:divalent-cation tolerance protein CutA [Anatilimnocola aggregata]QDU31432.1 Divalent-cation tolerance protein CutA [Anatilimnocola aggregata]
MPGEIIQIVTTTSEKESAEKIGAQILNRRLGACVQISGPVESSYWWNGRIETAREYLCTIKTVKEKFAQVERTILETHPYDKPEILATAVVEISTDYKAWLMEQLKPVKKAAPVKEENS